MHPSSLHLRRQAPPLQHAAAASPMIMITPPTAAPIATPFVPSSSSRVAIGTVVSTQLRSVLQNPSCVQHAELEPRAFSHSSASQHRSSSQSGAALNCMGRLSANCSEPPPLLIGTNSFVVGTPVSTPTELVNPVAGSVIIITRSSATSACGTAVEPCFAAETTKMSTLALIARVSAGSAATSSSGKVGRDRSRRLHVSVFTSVHTVKQLYSDGGKDCRADTDATASVHIFN